MSGFVLLLFLMWMVAQAKMDAIAENQRRENRLRYQKED